MTSDDSTEKNIQEMKSREFLFCKSEVEVTFSYYRYFQIIFIYY